MEDQIGIDKRQRSGKRNIILGLILALLPILFVSSLGNEAGLGLVVLAPIIFLVIVSGIVFFVRGLFLRFQSGQAKRISHWMSYAVLIIFLILAAYFIFHELRVCADSLYRNCLFG